MALLAAIKTALFVLVSNLKEDQSAVVLVCAPGAGGSIGCALSEKKRNLQPSKIKHSLIFERVSFQYLTF